MRAIAGVVVVAVVGVGELRQSVELRQTAEVRQTAEMRQTAEVRQAEEVRQTVEAPVAFASLFDGKSLQGWVTRGGHYDGDAQWSVEEGCITGRVGPNGEGGLLYTEGKYTCFELELEVKLDFPFDSGIFLRMEPELRGAQVTLDHREDGEIGAIYSDGFLAHNETAKARFRRDEWNRFRVRCTGFDMRIEVWMNGESITDYSTPPDSPGFAARGLIGLQVHGGRDDPPGNKVQFRNIRLRKLPVFGADRFEDGRGGWVAMTSTLASWEPHGDPLGYRVSPEGVLEIPARGGGELRSKENYRDFLLRLDFKLARMANSGLFLRARRDDSNPAYSGCEIQLIDDFDWGAVTGKPLEAWQHTGSLYGAVAPGVRALRPIGEWNTLELQYRGPRLAVALNGETLYDVHTHKLEVEPRFERRAAEGFIGLQRYGAPEVEGETAVWVREFFVRKL